MRLLAFDTSTDWISVAVSDGDDWHLHAERVAQDNSRRILPIISRTLAEAGFTLQALDGIAFGAGPGAFTGVRIACGIAQGLAFAIDRPVVGVSTLEALAHEAFRVHGAKRVVACLDARMREIYAACYVREQDEWRAMREPAVMAPLALALPDAEPWHGAGDGFAAYPDLAERLKLAGVDSNAVPSARAIGELALRRFAAGEAVSAPEARPFYVRHRVALTTAERDAGLRL